MIPVLKSTIEKPLTAVDYCAGLLLCVTITEVQEFCKQAPLEVRQDERFAKAVKQRLDVLATRRAAA